MPLTVRVEADLAVTVLEIVELEVTPPRPDFDAPAARAAESARAGNIPGPEAARALYRRFGVDPTRTRPSNEALLRRVRRGDPLPRVNSLVDVANVMSLLTQVPVGLYDLDSVQGGELTVRVGTEGEGYEGIGKDRVNVGGRLCVADATGPCGNPSSDSARTMITTATTRAAWIWFLPAGDEVLDRTYELLTRFGRGLPRVVEVAP